MRALAPIPSLLALVVLCSAGCNPNSLDGSIKSRFSLAFTKVQILRQTVDPNTYLTIQYDNGVEKPCKLTLNVTNLKLPRQNAVIDKEFVKVATFKRVAKDPNDYKVLLSGKVNFSDYSITPGVNVQGEFTAVFQDSYDIIGDFSGPVVSD